MKFEDYRQLWHLLMLQFAVNFSADRHDRILVWLVGLSLETCSAASLCDQWQKICGGMLVKLEVWKSWYICSSHRLCDCHYIGIAENRTLIRLGCGSTFSPNEICGGYRRVEGNFHPSSSQLGVLCSFPQFILWGRLRNPIFWLAEFYCFSFSLPIVVSQT
jgi:hypothetical protein